MGYTIKILHNCTYTRQNQVVFGEGDAAPIFGDTYEVSGRFSPHMGSVKVPQSVLRGMSPASMCALVIVDNDDDKFEYWYFVTGWQRLTVATLEIYLEPDTFHTYLFKNTGALTKKKTKITGLLEQTTALGAEWKIPFNQKSLDTLTGARFLTADIVMQNNTRYYQPVGDWSNVVFIWLTSEGNHLTTYCNATPFPLSQARTQYVDLLNSTEFKSISTGTDGLTFKFMRVFIVPKSILNIDFTKAFEYSFHTKDITADNGIKAYGLTGESAELKVDFNYYKSACESKTYIGTAYTLIPFNGTVGEKFAYLRFSFVDEVFITLRVGDRIEDITNDFEVNANGNTYEQYIAQHKTTNAIKSSTSLFSGVAQATSGAAQLAVGNIVGGASNLISGVTAPITDYFAREEKRREPNATAGNNLGFGNIWHEVKGFGFTTDNCIDGEEKRNLNNLYGAYFGAEDNTLYIDSTSFTKNEFFKFKFCRIDGLPMPASAKTELETLFTNGIFIRPYSQEEFFNR